MQLSMLSPAHPSVSLPPLTYRSSFHGADANTIFPPSSPYSSLSSSDGSALMDYPFVLPTPSTPSYSSSPLSSPYSLSTDESAASDFDTSQSQWRGGAESSPEWPASATSAIHPSAAALSSSEWSAPRLSSSLSHTSLRSVSSSASSVSSAATPTTPGQAPATKREVSSQALAQSTLKRKRNSVALNADERLQRRRAQHRAVDANRRQKENDAIARLHRLIRQQQQEAQQQAGGARLEGDVDSETGAADDADDDDAEEAAGRKAGRLTVLESSIALIEQLTTACKRMETACNAKDAQVSHVSSRLHSVAAAIAQQATALAFVEPVDGYAPPSLSMEYQQPWQQALMGYSAAHKLQHLQSPPRLHNASGPRLLTPGPGLASSAPSALSVLPSSTSSYLVHSDFSSTLRQTTTSLLNNMAVTVIVLPSKVVVDVNDRFLFMTGHSRSDVLYQPLDQVSMNANIPQYPASLEAVEELMMGNRRQANAIWRCRWGDGLLHEANVTFFAIYDEPWTGGASGEEKRMPDKVLFMSAPEEAIVVDEVLVPDGLVPHRPLRLLEWPAPPATSTLSFC